MAAVYLHPAQVAGRYYLAPSAAPTGSGGTTPPPTGVIDASLVPASRVVVFEGSLRVVTFEG